MQHTSLASHRQHAALQLRYLLVPLMQIMQRQSSVPVRTSRPCPAKGSLDNPSSQFRRGSLAVSKKCLNRQ